jgi:hypothetical protein
MANAAYEHTSHAGSIFFVAHSGVGASSGAFRCVNVSGANTDAGADIFIWGSATGTVHN